MRRTSLNLILTALLALSAAASWVVSPDPSLPGFLFLPDMVDSAAYGSFDENPFFRDGKTLREPVSHTLPRGLPWPDDAQGPEAGSQQRNPFSIDDSQVLDRGAAVFNRVCSPCHGSGGLGNGVTAQRGYPPPPSLLADKSLDLTDGEIFQIIADGQGNMPPHAALITREDRWKAILHIRALQAGSR